MSIETESLRPIRRLFGLLSKDKRDIGYLYLHAALGGLVALSLPLGIQAIIGLVLGGEVSTSWILLTILVTFGVVMAGALQAVQWSITEVLQRRIFTRSAFEFGFRIPRFRPEAVGSTYTPELVNRFFDTLSLQKGVAKVLLDFSTGGLQIVFGLLLLAFYHPVFIVFGALLILILVLIFRWTVPRGIATSLRESGEKYRLAHWLKELARAMNSFKLAGRTSLPEERTDEVVSAYLGHRRQHFRVLMTQYAAVVVFKALITAGLLVIGGLLVMDNLINVGQFVASEIVIIGVMGSAEKLMLTMESVYDVLTAVEKMGQVTDVPLEDEREGACVETVAPGGRGLSLKLEAAGLDRGSYIDRPVLDAVDLDIPAGARVAVVGASGSGKTSLLHVIAGLTPLDRGSMMVEGVPMADLDRRDLRYRTGDSLEQEVIFEGTLAENISVGRPGVDLGVVREAAESVGLMPLVQQLPQGFGTPIVSDGQGLSTGWVKRILLARAIVGKPRLLVLDRPLQPFPMEEHDAIAEALAGVAGKEGWTVVAASADAAWLSRCTHVVRLEEGRVVEVQTV